MSKGYEQIKKLLMSKASADIPDPVEAANYLRDMADDIERGDIVRFAFIGQDRKGEVIVTRRSLDRLKYIGMLEHAKTLGST